MSHTSFHDTTLAKEIRYNRATRDYDCYVDGRYVGSRSNYSDGEALCNEVAYDLITSGACYTATQLDGGSEHDPIVMSELCSDDEVFPDFTVGEGFTELSVCVCSKEKGGIELGIGGHFINEGVREVITLADLGRLYLNLGAILRDPRLIGAVR